MLIVKRRLGSWMSSGRVSIPEEVLKVDSDPVTPVCVMLILRQSTI